MACDKFELPTQDGVRKACEYFDSDDENKLIEPALTNLFARYPNNTNESEVLLKVLTLNDLYSTRIPTHAPRPSECVRCGKVHSETKRGPSAEGMLAPDRQHSQHYSVPRKENSQPLFVRHQVRKLAPTGDLPDVGR